MQGQFNKFNRFRILEEAPKFTDLDELQARVDTAPAPAPASHEEPWSVGEYNCKTSVVNAAGDEVAVFDSDKDADRAVQCVNACKGIADPVEAMKVARYALEEALEIAESLGNTYAANNARSALAKLNPA